MHVSTRLAAGVVVALIVLGSALYSVLTYRTTESVTVARISWELKINIEEFRTVRQDSWDLPPDARNVETRSEYHHSYRYVSGSHQSCSGTGSKRTCRAVLDYSWQSVYQDKYYGYSEYRVESPESTSYVDSEYRVESHLKN